MPNCAVITCRNRSDTCYSNNSGVSFHRFPKDPNTKEKWIETTGRGPNWFPLKSSTICSIHFTEKCFQMLKRGKKIFPWAVPTLKIPVITNSTNIEVKMEATTHNSPKESVPKETNQVPLEVWNIITVETCVPEEITGDQDPLEVTDFFSVEKCVPEVITDNQMQQQVPEGSETGRFVSIEESPRKKNYAKKIEQCQQLMKKQRTQIKSLQRKASRYRKKIGQLEDIIAELKGKN